MKAEREKRYSCTLTLIVALDKGGWFMPWSGHFTPSNDLVPIMQKAGWTPWPFGQADKISPPPPQQDLILGLSNP